MKYAADLIQLDHVGDIGMSEMIGLMRLHVQEVARFTTLISQSLVLDQQQVEELMEDCNGYQVDATPFVEETGAGNYQFSPLGLFLLKGCAKVHDIGKPLFRSIYRLERGLTEEEFVRQKMHADLTRVIVRSLLLDTRYSWQTPEIVRLVADFAAAHQEKLDGTGYPDGKAGREIPLLGRLLAIADALSAIVNPRPYQAETPLATALEWLKRDRGSHFDEKLLDGAVAVLEQEDYSSQRFSGNWADEAGFTGDFNLLLGNACKVQWGGVELELLETTQEELSSMQNLLKEGGEVELN